MNSSTKFDQYKEYMEQIKFFLLNGNKFKSDCDSRTKRAICKATSNLQYEIDGM